MDDDATVTSFDRPEFWLLKGQEVITKHKRKQKVDKSRELKRQANTFLTSDEREEQEENENQDPHSDGPSENDYREVIYYYTQGLQSDGNDFNLLYNLG